MKKKKIVKTNKRKPKAKHKKVVRPKLKEKIVKRHSNLIDVKVAKQVIESCSDYIEELQEKICNLECQLGLHAYTTPNETGIIENV